MAQSPLSTASIVLKFSNYWTRLNMVPWNHQLVSSPLDKTPQTSDVGELSLQLHQEFDAIDSITFPQMKSGTWSLSHGLCDVGGNQSFQKKPTGSWGECANSTYTIESGSRALWGTSSTNCATEKCHYQLLKIHNHNRSEYHPGWLSLHRQCHRSKLSYNETAALCASWGCNIDFIAITESYGTVQQTVVSEKPTFNRGFRNRMLHF